MRFYRVFPVLFSILFLVLQYFQAVRLRAVLWDIHSFAGCSMDYSLARMMFHGLFSILLVVLWITLISASCSMDYPNFCFLFHGLFSGPYDVPWIFLYSTCCSVNYPYFCFLFYGLFWKPLAVLWFIFIFLVYELDIYYFYSNSIEFKIVF